jgi:hypothetical protein
MGLYANLTNPPNPNPVDLLTWPNSVGGRIMAAANLAGNTATTLPEMIALIGEFQNIGWTWNPGIGGRNDDRGKHLLDLGIAAAGREGECGFLAHALKVLLEAPAPYGFGIGAGLAATVTYDGGGNGFVSPHAGVHHNLPANTSLPNGIALSPAYKWGDHVVVDYLGRFWDPSYNTHYANVQGMATHTVTNMVSGFIGRGPDIEVSIQCTPVAGGATVWYRAKKAWEAGLPHLPVGGWIGPTPAQTHAPAPPAVAQNNNCCVIL